MRLKIFSQSLAIFSIIGVDDILCVAILSIFFCRKAFSFLIFQLIAVVKIYFSGMNFLGIVGNFLESLQAAEGRFLLKVPQICVRSTKALPSLFLRTKVDEPSLYVLF